jgi:flagellar biosynthesis protein FlhB
MQDKTEAPTQKRKDESRKKGEIAKSSEITTAAVLLASAVAIKMAAVPVAIGMARVQQASAAVAGATDTGLTVQLISQSATTAFLAIVPAVMTIALVSIAVGAAQARGVLTTEPLSPKFERISPINNAKRMFGKQAIFELGKSLLKLGVIGAALYGSLRSAWPDIISAVQQSPAALAGLLHRYSVKILFTAGGAFLFIAAADYAYQLYTHHSRLRMTKEEIKQENKESEGDPLVKSRMRALGRALSRKRMMQDVPTADVVIANPTHIAIALRYDPSIAPAPIVVAMGERKIAQRIKAIAADAAVPVIENRPLARALLKTGRVGMPIPSELYVAVAEVLAFVFRHRHSKPVYA